MVFTPGEDAAIGNHGEEPFIVLLAMERLMGMILTTLAVEMFLGGLKQFLDS